MFTHNIMCKANNCYRERLCGDGLLGDLDRSPLLRLAGDLERWYPGPDLRRGLLPRRHGWGESRLGDLERRRGERDRRRSSRDLLGGGEYLGIFYSGKDKEYAFMGYTCEALFSQTIKPSRL